MNSIHSRGIWLTLLAISVGCSGGGGGGGGGGSATSTAGTLIALSTSNRLISFNPGAPQTVIATLTISGLQSGENIVAIDSRPSTGELLGLGSTSRLYRINPDTGSATAISAGPFTPALTGTDFGFDVDPVGDVVRVTSTTDQNLRLNPQTGAVTMADTTLAYAPGDPNAAMDPNVVGLAYTNDVSGAATTTLYGIDSTADVLVRVGSAGGSPISPDAGQLFTIGALGVDASGLVGFDVTPAGAAYACFTVSAATDSQLYTINLANGVATLRRHDRRWRNDPRSRRTPNDVAAHLRGHER